MGQKVYAISDLHLSITNPKPMNIFGGNWTNYLEEIQADWNKKVKDNDIVIIAGDISWAMTLEEAKPDLDFIGKLKGHKIIIKGNHEYWWGTISSVRKALPEKVYALQNDSLKIGKHIFCGTRGWMLPEKKQLSEEDNKVLAREVSRLEMSIKDALSKRKREKIICIMHYPPFNSQKIDSPFMQIIEKYKVKKVVYGHLHGRSSCTLFYKKNGVKYYLTSCDKVQNKLVRI